MTSHVVKIKRIYEPATPDDGFRILVDRLWPRGISKAEAALDLWDKEVAPSTELRKWWDHDPATFEEFKQKYLLELAQSQALDQLQGIVEVRPVTTLLYAATDPKLNQAVVLQQVIEEALTRNNS